jgi:hypothetical protein
MQKYSIKKQISHNSSGWTSQERHSSQGDAAKMTFRLGGLPQLFEIAAMENVSSSFFAIPCRPSIDAWGTLDERRFSTGALAPMTQRMRSYDIRVEHIRRFVARLFGGQFSMKVLESSGGLDSSLPNGNEWPAWRR